MRLEPSYAEGSDTEREVIRLVAASAKSFVRSQKDRLEEMESGETSMLPSDIAETCEQLGWLGAPSTPEPLSELGGPILPCLLYELGFASPALSAALLGHHVALAVLRAIERISPGALPHPFGEPARTGWFAQSPCCLLEWDHLPHDVASLSLHSVHGTTLEGTLPFVMRPHASAPLLAFAKNSARQTHLVYVPRLSAEQVTEVTTLGLRGLGLCDVHWDVTRPTAFAVWSADVDLQRVAAEVWRLALPAFAALASSVLSQCQALAESHAGSRWQAGKHIRDLPQVKEKLRLIDRHLAVTQLIARSIPEDAQIAKGFFATLRENLLEATDAGLQVLGGSGYVVGTGMERLWRDARQLSVLLG